MAPYSAKVNNRYSTTRGPTLVLNAAKRECSSVLSLADLRRSSCIRPAAEKTHSTPADEAGGSIAFAAGRHTQAIVSLLTIKR